MTNSIAFFQYSTEEDFSFVLEFTGLSLADRAFEVKIKDRASDTTRATLTLGAGLTVVGATEISAAVAKADMIATWPRGEYSADLVDVTDGLHSRIMAVRFVYDLPGNLVHGVSNRKAFVAWTEGKAYVTATGAVGPAGPPGPQGWSPEMAVVADGARRVLQVVDWQGGLGTKPEAGAYVGAVGLVPDIADAIDVRGPQGIQGIQGIQGEQGDEGPQGQKGWSPVLALVADDQRRVLRVVDWTGGEGTEPASGSYVGLGGLVADIADAVDIRGPEGSVVAPGSISTSDLAGHAVTDEKFRESAGLSVVGRAGDSAGDVADIVAATDGFVLRRVGDTLAFGRVDTDGLEDEAVTNVKLADMAAATVKGATASGSPDDLSGAAFRDGVQAPGALVDRAYVEATNLAGITTQIPGDDTIPQMAKAISCFR